MLLTNPRAETLQNAAVRISLALERYDLAPAVIDLNGLIGQRVTDRSALAAVWVYCSSFNFILSCYGCRLIRKSDLPDTGLAIRYEIVNKMNRQITLESQPGQGATFTIALKPATA